MTAGRRPSMDFGILLGLSYNAFIDQLHAALAQKGFDDLGILYGAVFRILAVGNVSLRELADRLDMTSAGALKIVNEMESRSYVRRLHRRFERELEAEYGAARVAAARSLLEAMVRADDESRGSPPPLRRIL
jgi:DNA-binding MarR family transcriptional regulator